MLIGLESSSLSNKTTGTERYVRCLYKTLKETDHHITLFSPRISKNKIYNKINKHFYRQFNISREMQKAEIDCGIFPDYFLPINFNKPSAIVIHDLSFISHPQFYSKRFVKFYKTQLKLTLKIDPLIITISEHSRKQINKFLEIEKDKIHLVQGYLNNSINNFSLEKGNYENPFLLYVGHIEPRKNLNFLIENFLEWKSRRKVNIKLKIVGELWIKNHSTFELLNKYKNHPDIEFTGSITEEKLNKLYKNASGFVHTSIEEGFGFPVLEAMNFNLPILCSEGIATSEISGEKSIKINPNDNASLINGLDKLYEKIISGEKINYQIPYTQNLMKEQLGIVLDKLKDKINHKEVYISPNTKTNSVDRAIEKTLVYANLFNSGINTEDLHKSIFDIKVNKDQIESALVKLSLEGKIIRTDNYIKLLKGTNDFYSKPKQKLDDKTSKKILRLINSLPFISSVAFSGGTANYGLNEHDDVDLFIITKPNTVYLVYLMIHILSLLFKVRNKLCANYLIDESSLKLKGERDFYIAHQIISLKTYKDSGALKLFKNRNYWVKYYFPNFDIEEPNYKPKYFRYKIFVPLNKLIKNGYRILYSNKLNKKIKNNSLNFSDHAIKLHTNDHRLKIINEFEKAWKEYKDKSFSETTIDRKYSNRAKAL